MTQDSRDLVPSSCGLVAFGEPTHREPAFGWVRNDLFARLVERGFRSIALETDRVAALAVDDYVREGVGSLDEVMRTGFSHEFGELDANRGLVAWLRAHNRDRPPAERVAFHGFDAPTEWDRAPAPRPYLEHVRDYLGLDLDLAGPAGDDERWSRTEAVLDAAESPGATAGADRLRALADDLDGLLHARAPERIESAASRARWLRARTHLTAGIGLLRYHRQAARPLELPARIAGLLAVRDELMARNLLDIRSVEAARGGTLVFAHNGHLQRNPTVWTMGEQDVTWYGAGRILAALATGGEEYLFVAGSLGRSNAVGLTDPAPDTYEGFLQSRDADADPGWSLTAASDVPRSGVRTDTTPEQGYFPLDEATVAGADLILHIRDGGAVERGRTSRQVG
ncbi:erythromycin esterase family protein [Kitasatospora sp. NPDC093806]|uniref:erythromycin esterase family protein n=1 Tax=Kitasatospora sp. NPDC093806 TaxID=3155075 RepID=UPI0034252E66